MATPTLGFENWFETTLSSSISSTDTTIPTNAVPASTEGYLVIEPDSSTNREVIYFTSKGASSVTCPSLALGRGQDGTSAVSHASGSTVRMNIVAAHLEALQDTSALGSNYTSSWIPGSGTWTYASSTTFTVPSADAASMSVGTRIKMTNSGTKYFNVVGISGTTVTVTGGTDYTVANAAITSPFFSNALSPQGFPHWFNHSPTWGGFSANPTTTSRFKIEGRLLTLVVRCTANGTSNATSLTLTTPVTTPNVASGMLWFTAGSGVDNGTALTNSARVYASNNSTTITAESNWTGGAWTGSNGKSVSFTLQHEI